MRKLIVDPQGRVVLRTKFVGHNKTANASKGNVGLSRLDTLRRGGVPHIAFIRSIGGIGDLLMITPTLHAAKKKYNAHITVATDPDYLQGALVKVLADNPDVDEILDYRDIQSNDYDQVVNLTCPCKQYEFPHAPPLNRIDIFAKHSGVPLEDPNIVYKVRDIEKQWIKEWLAIRKLNGHRLLVVQANSSTSRRDVSQIRLQKALMEIRNQVKDIRIVVVLHDNNAHPDVSWKLHGVYQFRNYDIRQIAALVEVSNMVICPDSAILHVASAFHKKTLTLFGPTDANARVNYHPEAVAISGGYNLNCWPSWFHPCHAGFACWKQIKEEMISDTAISMLQGKLLEDKPYYIHYGNMIKGRNTTSVKLTHSKMELL